MLAAVPSPYWSTAVGESFHVASPAAVTLLGYARAVDAWIVAEEPEG